MIPAPSAAPHLRVGWTNLSSGLSTEPPASYAWEATYDNLTRSVIAFGGCPSSLGSPCVNETWAFNFTNGWVELNSGASASPPAMQEPAMAYDPTLGAVVLFGGDDQGWSLSDTWEWKAGVWTDISSTLSNAPSGRFGATMAWDPAVGALVLTGGAGCGQRCTDTWEFNGSWNQISTRTSAPGVCYEGLVYDAADHYLLEVGGQTYYSGGNFQPTNGTWEFNGTDWIHLHPNRSPPREATISLAYDPITNEAVYMPPYTGATWIYQGGNWTNVTASLPASPSSRGYPGLVFDAADGYVILFGGALTTPPGSLGGPQGSCGSSSTTCANDTWAFRGPGGALFTSAEASPTTTDVGRPVVFSDTTVLGGHGPYSYVWQFGDGSTGTGRLATHVYRASGSYTAIVTVSDSAHHSTNATVPITVNPDPKIAAVASPSRTDVGLPVSFAAIVAGGTAPFAYRWSFGNGHSSSGSTATMSFASAGTYRVRVNVTDAVGKTTYAELKIVVDPSLAVRNLTSSPSPAVVGHAVNFTLSLSGGSTPYTIAWRFGDGTRGGNLQNISHIFLSTGQFKVRVTVTDAAGEVVEASLLVTVV